MVHSIVAGKAFHAAQKEVISSFLKRCDELYGTKGNPKNIQMETKQAVE